MASAAIHVLCTLCVVNTARVRSIMKRPFGLPWTPGYGWPWICSDFEKEGSLSIWNGDDEPQSCLEAWRDNENATARCAWIDDDIKCVPHCLHQDNQNVDRCEEPFCLWDADASSCSFNPKKNNVRRAFCDREAGHFDRRLVDKDGRQPDFYDHNLVKEQDGFGDGKKSRVSWRKVFCRDMLGDGDDEYVDQDASPADAVLAGAMRCWRPSPTNRASYRDVQAQAAMKAQFKLASDYVVVGAQLSMHPVLMSRPLNGVLARFHHWIAGLTNVFPGNEGGLSTCLDAKYNDFDNTEDLDPAGCNFFKASFKPLQELHRCMMPLIQEDPYKQLWKRVAEASRNQNGTVFAMAANLSSKADGHMQWLIQQLPQEHLSFPLLLQQWIDCEENGACSGWLDEYERTTEIIKQIEQDSWEGLDLVGVRELVQQRLVRTLATPVDSLAPALSQGTVNTITDKCFKLQLDDPGTPAADTPYTALVLKESLRCMPLMWDGAHIPALPLTSLWPGRWQTPIVADTKMHPVCARMAVAGLVRVFSRTKYPRSWKILRLLPIEDNLCLTLTGASCINFKDCFSSYLENHVGVVGDFCIPNPTCCCKAPKPPPCDPATMNVNASHPSLHGSDGSADEIEPSQWLRQSRLWTEVESGEIDQEEFPPSPQEQGHQRSGGSSPRKCCDFQQNGCAKGFEKAEDDLCLPDTLVQSSIKSTKDAVMKFSAGSV